MKVTLRNLGRLREASIDLGKDLILLAGPNNTSKTYVAHVIYGLGEYAPIGLTPATRNVLQALAADQPEAELRFKVDVIQLVDQHLPQLLAHLAKGYREHLSDVLASDDSFVSQTEVVLGWEMAVHAFDRQSFLGSVFDKEKSIRGVDGAYSIIHKGAGEPTITFELIEPSYPSAGLKDSKSSPRESPLLSYAAGYTSGFLAALLLHLRADQYILTAERAAIQLFSRELALKRTELVDSLLSLKSSARRGYDAGEAILEQLEQKAQRYPLAIRDSLLLANDLAVHKKRISPFASLADELENKILGGALRVDEDGELLFHPDGSASGLSLHLSSSSVKSLAGLSFFLRHMAQKGQFLIIDEPELNLHPDNQRRVARVLARLARSGIKVLISTHSDYLIRELNNLIMLSADTDGTLRQRHGYDEEETLQPAQVGAYLFNTERSQPIEVKETGIEVETIDREINALNAVSQDIYFSLFGKTSV